MPINLAKIVLADYHQTNLFSNNKDDQEKKIADELEKEFTVIGESDRLVAFKNKSEDTFKLSSIDSRVILPLWFCWSIMFLLVGYIIHQLRKIE